MHNYLTIRRYSCIYLYVTAYFYTNIPLSIMLCVWRARSNTFCHVLIWRWERGKERDRVFFALLQTCSANNARNYKSATSFSRAAFCFNKCVIVQFMLILIATMICVAVYFIKNNWQAQRYACYIKLELCRVYDMDYNLVCIIEMFATLRCLYCYATHEY